MQTYSSAVSLRTFRHAALAGVLGVLAACGDSPTGVGDPATQGSILVRLSNLPPGRTPSARVTGPGGFAVDLTSPQQVLDRLVPGTYTLTLGVVAGTPTLYPASASQSVQVVAGQQAIANTLYAALPMQGAFVPSLSALDSTLLRFMGDRNIRAATLAVSRGGQMILSRAFGYRDAAGTEPLQPNAVLRLASNSKPITAAAVRKLVGEGRLSLTDRVLPLLALEPLGGPLGDARLGDVTIAHLLDHRGGWDRDIHGDVVFFARQYASALGMTRPLDKTELARHVLTMPLQFTPGERFAYSNFGYLLLGLVVEQVTGTTVTDYVRQQVLLEAAASEFIVSATLASSRDPREPDYIDSNIACSVFVIASCTLVSAVHGAWWNEQFDAFGGWAASAPALLAFSDRYWLSGAPRAPGSTGQQYAFLGSLPGTFTLSRQFADGTNLVVLFNQRTVPPGFPMEAILSTMDAAKARVAGWP